MRITDPLPRRVLLAYGALGFPLAFVALPLYVHVPHLYASELGLSLASVGFMLLWVRIGDAVIDPWIGRISDAYQARQAQRRHRNDARRQLILLALLPLAIGFVLLLNPPASAGLFWLATSMLICFIGYSVATINYHAWGAELAGGAMHQGMAVRITSVREALALCGVIVAAALPNLISGADASGAESSGVHALAWLFPPLLGVAALALWRGVPLSPAHGTPPREASLPAPTSALTIRQLLHADPAFGRLLLVLAMGGIAAAIPATLVLFYIADVLQLATWQGGFLALYFVAGASAMPLWIRLADRFGKLSAWALAMAVALLSFLWAAFLGPGDGLAFSLICVASGAALGAELALPPALLAERLHRTATSTTAAPAAGAYFGVWNFVNKLSLALAAGIALPLLDSLGYEAGSGSTDKAGLTALALVYALLPAALKALALGVLIRWRHYLK